MARVTVYNFTMYSALTDQMVTSRRMGTREAIAKVGGVVVEGSGVEIEDSRLDRDVIPGLTPIGFEP